MSSSKVTDVITCQLRQVECGKVCDKEMTRFVRSKATEMLAKRIVVKLTTLGRSLSEAFLLCWHPKTSQRIVGKQFGQNSAQKLLMKYKKRRSNDAVLGNSHVRQCRHACMVVQEAIAITWCQAILMMALDQNHRNKAKGPH